jgi:hypothetical protein
MSVTPELLTNTWQSIRNRIHQALPGTVLEQSLPVLGEGKLSAVVRVKDAVSGIVIRVPSCWSPPGWQVVRLTGVWFDPLIADRDEVLIPIMLADEDAVDIFAVFAADLASVISGADKLEVRMRLLMDKIALWKRFFRKNNSPLSEEEVRGLIGEIEVAAMMIGAYGVDMALDMWRGPAGELHDFRHDAFRVEVKTWLNESAPRIFISDPAQVVIDSGWPVFIAAVQLAKDRTAGFTISERITKLMEAMTGTQRDVLGVLLAEVGYLPVHAELYHKRYSVTESVFYKIGDGFPLINPLALPGGITNLKYSLELGALFPFISVSPIAP